MSFTYLASPYTHKLKSVVEQRFQEAQCATHILLCQGMHIYSPIVHCHELAKKFELPTDAEFWQSYNYAMLCKASKLIILTLKDWQLSLGIQGENKLAQHLSIPVDFITPEDLNLAEALRLTCQDK